MAKDGFLTYGIIMDDDDFLYDYNQNKDIKFIDFLAKYFPIPGGKTNFDLPEIIGINLEYHGGFANIYYIICILESKITAYTYDYPREIRELKNSYPEWNNRLKVFCEKTELKFKEPKYYLCNCLI